MILTHTSEPLPNRSGQVVEVQDVQDGERFTTADGFTFSNSPYYTRDGDDLIYSNSLPPIRKYWMGVLETHQNIKLIKVRIL